MHVDVSARQAAKASVDMISTCFLENILVSEQKETYYDLGPVFPGMGISIIKIRQS